MSNGMVSALSRFQSLHGSPRILAMLSTLVFLGVAVAFSPSASAQGTCNGFCGGKSASTCWCDDLCTGFGDCCEDFKLVCEPEICGGIAGKVCSDPTDFCDFPTGACGFGDFQGICTAACSACTDEFDPVCGCDGQTYSNSCEAKCAQVSIKHVGPCVKRFEDCGDGTVADHQTGLQWEKKMGTVGSRVLCHLVPCPDPHDVNNRYQWSAGGGGSDPDGVAFTDFLARLNGDPTVVEATFPEALGDPAADPTVCLTHHCDWRLPAIGELRTILIGPGAAPGQPSTCGDDPCIDPGFAAVGGPTAASLHWSGSTVKAIFRNGPPRIEAYVAGFGAAESTGEVGIRNKISRDVAVRAVRHGTCQ